MDIIKIIEKINEVGLSNNDITRYGDGFEDAIFKVKEVITELYKETQALQLQQTGVMRCFSDDHIGVIARNIAKEYAFENEYMFNQFTEAITKGMKIGRKVIQQNNA